MSNRAKFVHWLESPFSDIPSEPMFNIIGNETTLARGSTLCGGTLLAAGINLPLFPSLETWKRETESKRRCFRCWAVTRNYSDWVHHREAVHGEKVTVTP